MKFHLVRSGKRCAVSLAVILSCLLADTASAQVDSIADIPFEQLLQTEVITAERLAKQISNAPSAVSIVTARDIKDFGYRSLSDILDSMRGLSMSHSNHYGNLAGRAFTSPNDFAGRITLLIDGYRAPDNFWGQIYFGNDGLLDVELIERVEYIPGSGSSDYGDSAFLGVINIITKKGGEINATQVAGGLGSHDLHQERAAFGKKFDNGLDLLVSASTLSQGGRYLPPEYGIDGTVPFEKETNQRLFLKAAYDSWTFESAFASRSQPDPYGLAGPSDEENAFVSLKYDAELITDLKSSSHFYVGHYGFQTYQVDGWQSINQRGDWWGLDSKLVSTRFERQRVMLGAEYRSDFKQSLWSQDSQLSPASDLYTQRKTWSLYAYDDLQLADNLHLNLGARADARDNRGTDFSPRAALVYAPLHGTTLKLSTGKAIRQPTAAMELGQGILDAEHLRTNELVWEQSLGPKTRLTSALYSYHIDNYSLIYFDQDSYAWTTSYGSLSAKGAELELEHLWDNGVRLQASYVVQDAQTSLQRPILNFAKNIAKLNLSAPVAGDWLRAGLAVRYLGSRPNWNNEFFQSSSGYDPQSWVADLTLTAKWDRWFASFSIRNLGDVAYTEIASKYYGDSIPVHSYAADRRHFWLQIGYEFK